ncbi:hypothetical protein [Streptomyces sp. LMG1-1-1.1]|uniref:hypothetical protein n=1 Tax=Streptomyces sp. LMG1-1-1.1 TaxID=3135245 RepID=UPI0034661D9E
MDAAAVAALVAAVVAAPIGYVVTGVELEMRCPRAPADAPWPPGRGPAGNTAPRRPSDSGALRGPAEERRCRIWELILPGLVRPAAPRPGVTRPRVTRPGGSALGRGEPGTASAPA